MRISIIVPTLNEQECIIPTLQSLQQLEGEKEIIVVDGGSSDETRSRASRERARVLTTPPGRGVQMHAGALEAAGDVLWFLHADTVPPVHALEEIRMYLEDPLVVGGNFGLVFDGCSRSAKQLTAVYPILRMLGLCYGDSGIFVKRDVYHQIGGFRPFALFEDLDLLRRLRRVGKFVHVQSKIVTSSRRFEQRNFALVWLQWTALQVLYWCGISPNWLARKYRPIRRSAA